MPKFFVPSHYIFGDYALIRGQEALHIYKVLRLKPGEKIRIFDGNGSEYHCEIRKTKKDLVEVIILNKLLGNPEPPVNTTLFQCIPKGNKMDFIVQKATELGITTIVPVISSRVVVKLDDMKRVTNRIERWEKIALEACKQSDRSYIPRINKILLLKDCIKTEMALNSQLQLVLWEEEKKAYFKNILKRCVNDNIYNVSFYVGPEGGFTTEEVDLLKKSGNITVSMGPRFLRTETATISFLSIIMYELGDMGG